MCPKTSYNRNSDSTWTPSDACPGSAVYPACENGFLYQRLEIATVTTPPAVWQSQDTLKLFALERVKVIYSFSRKERYNNFSVYFKLKKQFKKRIQLFTLPAHNDFFSIYDSFIYFLLLFKYSCLRFPLTTLPSPTDPHLSPSVLSPFGFVHGSFVHVPR